MRHLQTQHRLSNVSELVIGGLYLLESISAVIRSPTTTLQCKLIALLSFLTFKL
jgi:hypothetical protein